MILSKIFMLVPVLGLQQFSTRLVGNIDAHWVIYNLGPGMSFWAKPNLCINFFTSHFVWPSTLKLWWKTNQRYSREIQESLLDSSHNTPIFLQVLELSDKEMLLDKVPTTVVIYKVKCLTSDSSVNHNSTSYGCVAFSHKDIAVGTVLI